MPAVSKSLWRFGDGMFLHWCPACKKAHAINTDRAHPPAWSFDGNLERPTFGPSVRFFLPAQDGRPERTLCHYFIAAGEIRFCADSAHALAGRNVPLPELPSDYGWPGE